MTIKIRWLLALFLALCFLAPSLQAQAASKQASLQKRLDHVREDIRAIEARMKKYEKHIENIDSGKLYYHFREVGPSQGEENSPVFLYKYTRSQVQAYQKRHALQHQYEEDQKATALVRSRCEKLLKIQKEIWYSKKAREKELMGLIEQADRQAWEKPQEDELAGTWNGKWKNSTFKSSGGCTFTITASGTDANVYLLSGDKGFGVWEGTKSGNSISFKTKKKSKYTYSGTITVNGPNKLTVSYNGKGKHHKGNSWSGTINLTR